MKRNYLFLQGNASPFYVRLGQRLAERGHGVRRINFCAGDALFWRDAQSDNFCEDMSRWHSYVKNYYQREGITDIVCFGDCRPVHREAIALAKALKITVHVFEEGYLRPNWLTLERDGVNGFSNLPKSAQWYQDTARKLVDGPTAKPVGGGMRRRVLYDFMWQAANYLWFYRYPKFNTHRPYPIWAEYMTWVKRLSTLKWRQAQARKVIDDLVDREQSYFLFPLQLDSDFQVRIHSSFGGMVPAIETVVRSFANHAPNECVLLVKNHPLDNGWINYRNLLRKLANQYGFGERLCFVDGGDLEVLLGHALGTVLVNSTVGMTALERGVATKCLGEAVYNIAGLTSQVGLDEFWQSPMVPNAQLWLDFRKVLMHTCLVNGNYYTDVGIETAVEASLLIMEQEATRANTISSKQIES